MKNDEILLGNAMPFKSEKNFYFKPSNKLTVQLIGMLLEEMKLTVTKEAYDRLDTQLQQFFA